MIRINALASYDRSSSVYTSIPLMFVRPAGQPLANRRRRRAAFSRPPVRPPTIFMHVEIAGAETRSIERTENRAQWLIEFASCLGAPVAAVRFRSEPFDAAGK